METAPFRTGLEQLITVEGTAPATSTVGTPFVMTILPYTLTMPLTLYGFTVVDGSSFVRVHRGRRLNRSGFRPIDSSDRT